MLDPPSGGRGRGRPRRQGADEEILTVALAMLREHGYRELTVDAVAERARLAKTTVYRRWPSKQSLVAAALAPLAAAHRGPGVGGTLESDLTFILHEVVAFLGMAGDASQEPEMAEAIRAALLPDRLRLEAILTGHAVPGDPSLPADLLLSAVLMGRREVETVVRIVLHGCIPGIRKARTDVE